MTSKSFIAKEFLTEIQMPSLGDPVKRSANIVRMPRMPFGRETDISVKVLTTEDPWSSSEIQKAQLLTPQYTPEHGARTAPCQSGSFNIFANNGSNPSSKLSSAIERPFIESRSHNDRPMNGFLSDRDEFSSGIAPKCLIGPSSADHRYRMSFDTIENRAVRFHGDEFPITFG
ncbi:hypothetical protein AVEN_102146-1 [Araneus ventricosus]|uniref:Uncharacterized protein n=1 Tax=Araneus ventricosus TaxID=182803 RepID=A0A4Y2LL99_ARAVE|nr:hypothetical protein AVEN_102146-1 [Araneus ventricosus]